MGGTPCEEQAIRWLDEFEAALETLSRAPLKHPLAPESSEFPFEIRQMVYGVGKRPMHRAVFEVRKDTVIVHCIRHLARQKVTPDDRNA